MFLATVALRTHCTIVAQEENRAIDKEIFWKLRVQLEEIGGGRDNCTAEARLRKLKAAPLAAAPEPISSSVQHYSLAVASSTVLSTADVTSALALLRSTSALTDAYTYYFYCCCQDEADAEALIELLAAVSADQDVERLQQMSEDIAANAQKILQSLGDCRAVTAQSALVSFGGPTRKHHLAHSCRTNQQHLASMQHICFKLVLTGCALARFDTTCSSAPAVLSRTATHMKLCTWCMLCCAWLTLYRPKRRRASCLHCFKSGSSKATQGSMMLKQLYEACLAAAAVQLLEAAAVAAAVVALVRSEALCVLAAACDCSAATCSDQQWGTLTRDCILYITSTMNDDAAHTRLLLHYSAGIRVHLFVPVLAAFVELHLSQRRRDQ
eukprot:12764-Heterococcus_DN1.PRE.1